MVIPLCFADVRSSTVTQPWPIAAWGNATTGNICAVVIVFSHRLEGEHLNVLQIGSVVLWQLFIADSPVE